MDTQVLKAFGEVGGIAGLGFGVFFLLFRNLLKKVVAPRMTPTQWFRVVVIFMVLVWSIALFGLGAWLYAAVINPTRTKDPEPAGSREPDNSLQTFTDKNAEPNTPPASTPESLPAATALSERVTLERLFETDFETLLKAKRHRTLSHGGSPIDIQEQLYMDFLTRSKFVGFFIPQSARTAQIIDFLADKFALPFPLGDSVPEGGFIGERTKSEDLVFTGRVYIYHESPLHLQDLATLQRKYQSVGAEVQFRGPDYLTFKLVSRAASGQP